MFRRIAMEKRTSPEPDRRLTCLYGQSPLITALSGLSELAANHTITAKLRPSTTLEEVPLSDLRRHLRYSAQ
jgi:hypothetical protein